MCNKFNLPITTNPRRELKTKEINIQGSNTIAKTDNKFQGTIEKQKLEQIKNAGEIVKIARSCVEIIKIRESTNSQLAVIDAKMKQMESETKNYVHKLEAETSQFIAKGQVATSIIQAVSDLINQNDDLDANVKLEAIKSISNLVRAVVGK